MNFTGAEIALHENDKYMLENGQVVWHSAASTWGHVARCLLKPLTTSPLSVNSEKGFYESVSERIPRGLQPWSFNIFLLA